MNGSLKLSTAIFEGTLPASKSRERREWCVSAAVVRPSGIPASEGESPPRPSERLRDVL
jgi:hypothetical protein